ncbi:hypothetical protein B0H14DRAFT_3665157, partial [Mycena olivaceomarginata]
MQQPIYNTTINGGVGGTGGVGGKDGGDGGDGSGPRVNVVNTPSQTILQGSGAGINIGHVHNYCQSRHVSPKQALPLNIVDETLSQPQIYCNQLLSLRRGFPLYIPGPSQMLPAEYQTSGIQIGDVGTVTPEGLFDCFFNIYLPADDPVNLDNVPDDFLSTAELQGKRSSHVSSSPRKLCLNPIGSQDCAWYSTGVSHNAILCRPPQGAVLALPHGAELKRLKNVQPVREYAQKYAKTWYEYLKHTKGLVVENGSLYLITGCEKVMSWGMATYHST